MQEELTALYSNNTWHLVPRPSNTNIIGSKWVYHIKYKEDGSIDRYKARLVARGFTQVSGLDYDETFSPVIKPATIRIILSLAVVSCWTIKQLDVKNAFLHGFLKETVYMEQPPGSNDTLIQQIIHKLGCEFSLKDLGALHYFLGIEVKPFASGLFLSQTKYTKDLLSRAHMLESSHQSTPIALKPPNLLDDHNLVNETEFRSIVGALQYLTFTRPDITHAVNKVCQHFHQPTLANLRAIKRILRYLKGTITYGIRFLSQISLTLNGFCDANWAGCPLTRRSTTGYCIFLGSNCVSWSSKKQPTVACSSAKAEYRALAATTAELTWIGYLLCDLGIRLIQPPWLFCDNIRALHMTKNHVFHARTKHIELDYHFIREKVTRGDLVTKYVTSPLQTADVLTKALPKSSFKTF
ncbi:uncharacterized protein LOC112091139 [Morus notabilis]|uniref:uncharacterized protein LOC112091139 n=1 Tax=Morus notabilis TaxID=981085 RepID=UPI000CED28DD|nr:uncharacterized protein LOC112091139 [Morus notabilis]